MNTQYIWPRTPPFPGPMVKMPHFGDPVRVCEWAAADCGAAGPVCCFQRILEFGRLEGGGIGVA